MHTSHNQVTALAELTSSQSQPAGIRATLVFIAISLFCAVTALPSPDFIQLVDSNLIIDEEEGVRLGPRWLFHEGDNSAWADPGFDDSDWTLRNSYVQASRDVLDEWTGIGWYRYHISIDSTVAGRPLGMRISHTGALEIFADGEYIASVGTVSASPEGEEVVVRYLAPPIRLVFEQPGEHVLAIRYSNHEEGQTYRWGWGIGFYANVAYYEHYLDHMLGELERAVTQQGFFTGIDVSFLSLHKRESLLRHFGPCPSRPGLFPH